MPPNRRAEPSRAASVLAALRVRGWQLAVAESLTGGLLTSQFAAVPGASTVLRGGVVSYATEVKAEVLGVDAELLAARGAVDPDVAAAMATGVRALLGAEVGLATTGVAGPAPQDGQPVGMVYLACVHPGGLWVRNYLVSGTRQTIRESVAGLAIALAATAISVPARDGNKSGASLR